jgi:hypothetical protein
MLKLKKRRPTVSDATGSNSGPCERIHRCPRGQFIDGPDSPSKAAESRRLCQDTP